MRGRTAEKAGCGLMWSERAAMTDGHALTTCCMVLYTRGLPVNCVGKRKRVVLLVGTVTWASLHVLPST